MIGGIELGGTKCVVAVANNPLDISLIGSYFYGFMPGSVSETSSIAILFGAII